jgi:acyl-CoA thioesterase YciA
MCTAKRQLAVRLPMMPRDASELGNISGGVILSQIDLAAAIVSRKACQNMRINRMVTRAMNEVEFRHPVLVGDVLCCYGTITRVGTTSVTVLVEVEADRHGQIIPVTEATAVFVALDENDKPTALCGHKPAAKPLVPEIKVDKIIASTPPAERGERIVALKKYMMPNETNGMGNIFGGLLLTYMDWAGSYVARRACKNKVITRCVTRFMDKIEFKQPVHVNDIITCYGSVTKVGETSVSVHIEVEADRQGKIIPVTQADLVFVAVNKRGKKVPVACAESRSIRTSSRKRKARTAAPTPTCSCRGKN